MARRPSEITHFVTPFSNGLRDWPAPTSSPHKHTQYCNLNKQTADQARPARLTSHTERRDVMTKAMHAITTTYGTVTAVTSLQLPQRPRSRLLIMVSTSPCSTIAFTVRSELLVRIKSNAVCVCVLHQVMEQALQTSCVAC